MLSAPGRRGSGPTTVTCPGSDRDELDGADRVAGQDGPGQLRVGAERLGHRDRTGLEGRARLARSVAGTRGPGTATRPRCVDGPRPRKARTASPVAGGATRGERRGDRAGLWCEPPTAGRAARPPGWPAGRWSRPRRAPARRAHGPGRTGAAPRASAGPAPPGSRARAPGSSRRARICSARVQRTGLGHGARARRPWRGARPSVSSSGTTTISSWPFLHQPVDDRLEGRAWTSSRNARLDACRSGRIATHLRRRAP